MRPYCAETVHRYEPLAVLTATLPRVTHAVIAELLDAIPESLRDHSGTALDSGLASWTGSCPIYLLGYNPGGEPGTDTIYGNAENLLRNFPANYSGYRDGTWNPGGRWHAKGQAPMQRRVLYLLDRLGLDPGDVPTSNVIYVRSRQLAHLSREQADGWAEDCWPFHARMIERLGVKVIVCLGGDAAWFVRDKLNAHTHVDTFKETYATRHWASRTYTGPGPTVVQLTHPGRADWTSPVADPTGLVVRALEAHRETN